MSSLVCQGQLSFFEPLIFEPCGLNHHIDKPKPNLWPEIPLIIENHNQHQAKFTNNNNNPSNSFDPKNNKSDESSWNFVESLSKKSEQANQVENVYVHPLVKKSSSLSLKSLEMCTESLGSETGDEFSFPLSPKTNEEYHQMWRLKYEMSNKKVSRNNNFPPPLTSISGSDTVQVTPHREGGRLVLRAASASPHNSCFQAERVAGRLRLCLVEDNSYTSDNSEIDEYELESGEEEYDDEDEIWIEEIGGNSEIFGCEDQAMPRRCKESGHENQGMPCWGVAIS